MHYLFPVVFLFIAQTALASEYAFNDFKQPASIGRGTLKILGGVSSQRNTWNWVVSLRTSISHLCVGSILNEWYIITAAHCFTKAIHLLSLITVCAGTKFSSDTCPQRRSIQYVINHPAYNSFRHVNDIALIRVNIPFNFSDTSIAHIHLPGASPNNDYPQPNKDVTTVGWGSTEISEDSYTLQEVTLQIVNKSVHACNEIVYNHTLQLCAAASEKDTCKGDSGGPLMVFGASQHWELVGITSYGWGCAKAHPGVYTRITAFLTFIQMIINNRSATPTTNTCSCQCPRGSDQGVAYTTRNTPEACVDACRAAPSNRCIRSNTYACLGTNCAYSASYNYTMVTSTTQYTCSCQCPRGSYDGVAYTTRNGPEACVDACRAAPSNRCLRSNTYACLGTNCAYSDSYDHTITTTTSTAQYTCSCQCPHGSDQGLAFTTRNTPKDCADACQAVSSNTCVRSNTYACLGTNCTYSDSYDHTITTSTSTAQYTCSCQCPRGSDQGVAYTTKNSPQACVDACRAAPSNRCLRSNTYACLGANCTYSDSYDHTMTTTTSTTQYTCSCQCPHGSDQGVAYASRNSPEDCVDACQAVPWNRCIRSNTYACLGTNCAYSDSYNHTTTTTTPTAQYTCSCQCPHGSDQGVAYASRNSPEDCVDACQAVPWNRCIRSNTYACLGTNCTFSDSYDHTITTSTSTAEYTCSCQCPHGSDQGVAYASRNTPEACVDACQAVSWNACVESNTYACLGRNCTYSDSYDHTTITTTSTAQYTCSCQCPHGSDQGVAYASRNTPEACVDACQAVSSNTCVGSNTYACLGTNCTFSDSYNHTITTTTSTTQFTCSCQCPRGSYDGVAYTTRNSSEACVDACQAVSSNICVGSNTYACLGANCAYSNSYSY